MAIQHSVSEYYLFQCAEEICSIVLAGQDVALERAGTCEVALAHGYPPNPIERLTWDDFVTPDHFVHVHTLVVQQYGTVAALVDVHSAITVAPIHLIDPCGFIPPRPPLLEVETIRDVIWLEPYEAERQRAGRYFAPVITSSMREYEPELIVESIRIDTIVRHDSRNVIERLIGWLCDMIFGTPPQK